MTLCVTSALAFIILKNQMITSAKEKKPCIRRKTATIESQYNEIHHRISNETIIPLVCMYNYVDEGTSVSQQQRFAVTALMLNPDTKKDLRFQPLSKQVF